MRHQGDAPADHPFEGLKQPRTSTGANALECSRQTPPSCENRQPRNAARVPTTTNLLLLLLLPELPQRPAAANCSSLNQAFSHTHTER